MNPTVAEKQPETTIIRIQSQFSATLIYMGRVSGKSYRWDGAGAIADVDEEDAPYLLSKRIGRTGCCGGVAGGNVLFAKI